jgi:hypothetical protein
MAYLYRHIRKDKNEVFYIGIGSDNGFYRAKEAKRRNNHWIGITNKTKWFSEIIISDISYELAKIKEIEFIEIYKRKEDGGTLCNKTKGGEGSLGLTPCNVKKIYVRLKTNFNILFFKSYSDFKIFANVKSIYVNKNGNFSTKKYFLSENKNDLLSEFAPIESFTGKHKIMGKVKWLNTKTNEFVETNTLGMAKHTNLSIGVFNHLRNGRQKTTKCGWVYIGK